MSHAIHRTAPLRSAAPKMMATFLCVRVTATSPSSYMPCDQSVALRIAQCLREHALGDVADGTHASSLEITWLQRTASLRKTEEVSIRDYPRKELKCRSLFLPVFGHPLPRQRPRHTRRWNLPPPFYSPGHQPACEALRSARAMCLLIQSLLGNTSQVDDLLNAHDVHCECFSSALHQSGREDAF